MRFISMHFISIFSLLLISEVCSVKYHQPRDVDEDVYEEKLLNLLGLKNEEEAAHDADWTGEWFPTPPPLTKKKVNMFPIPKELQDEKHGVKMGIPSAVCDDGKTNLTVDWDFSPNAYACFSPSQFPVKEELEYKLHCDDIPPTYVPQHYCMWRNITYEDRIPTHGDHRPLWAKYGEYIFVPKQRWLHNIEHGGVVMLYHPCADVYEVRKLKFLLRNCIRKHVITPCPLLSHDRPLALVTWGCRLEMAHVQTKVVTEFIRKGALQGPEGHHVEDGQFTVGLIEAARIPPGSDINDSLLCAMLP